MDLSPVKQRIGHFESLTVSHHPLSIEVPTNQEHENRALEVSEITKPTACIRRIREKVHLSVTTWPQTGYEPVVSRVQCRLVHPKPQRLSEPAAKRLVKLWKTQFAI